MVFAVFLAKLLDPIVIILAIVAGVISRAWWHVAIAAFVIAAIGEMILSATQITRTFNPIFFGIGVIAAAAWAAIVFLLKRRWAARSNSN